MFFSLLVFFACALQIVAGGTACDPASLHSASSLTTADPPVFNETLSGFLSQTDNLTIAFNWPSYGVGNRSITLASSGFVPLGDSAGALCSANGDSWLLGGANQTALLSLGGVSSCVDSLTSVFSWGGAKAACGATYFASSGGDVNFVYRITYTEIMYDPSTGDATGTRSVQQDFSFDISTPTTFNVTSSAPLTLFGTTALITAQKIVNSTSGDVLVNFTVMSDCSNTISNPSITATSATAQVGSPSAVITNSTPAVTGTFAGLCTYSFSSIFTPVPLGGSCNIDGGYTLVLTITFQDSTTATATYPITLASSDTCTKINLDVGKAVPSLQLYHNISDALNVSGTTNVLGNLATVSLGDTAHWRIVFPPTIGTPIITAWSLINVTWGTTADAAEAGNKPVPGATKEAVTDAIYGTTVATTQPPISTDYSYFFFNYTWDGNFTDHPLTSGPAGPVNNAPGGFSMQVFISVFFNVTYAPTTRSHARTELRVITSKMAPRSSPGASSSAVSVGHMLVENSTPAASSNVALIASLAAVAAILVLAAVAFAMFLGMRRRRQQAKQTAVAAAPEVSMEPGFVTL